MGLNPCEIMAIMYKKVDAGIKNPRRAIAEI